MFGAAERRDYRNRFLLLPKRSIATMAA